MTVALRALLHLLHNWLLKLISMVSVVIIQCLILLLLLACKAPVHAFVTLHPNKRKMMTRINQAEVVL